MAGCESIEAAKMTCPLLDQLTKIQENKASHWLGQLVALPKGTGGCYAQHTVCAFTPTGAGVPVSLNTWCIISTTHTWSSQLWPGTTVTLLILLILFLGEKEGLQYYWLIQVKVCEHFWHECRVRTQDNSYVIWQETKAAWIINKVCISPILSADVTTMSNGTLGVNYLLSAKFRGSKGSCCKAGSTRPRSHEGIVII